MSEDEKEMIKLLSSIFHDFRVYGDMEIDDCDVKKLCEKLNINYKDLVEYYYYG